MLFSLGKRLEVHHRRLEIPLNLQVQRVIVRNEQGIFWAAHQAGLAYFHIERLMNLGMLSTQRANAVQAWVVAIMDRVVNMIQAGLMDMEDLYGVKVFVSWSVYL